jgi:hypothetical protein
VGAHYERPTNLISQKREEKPWKYPGGDISDFFNFGLNEESWKDYCKQLVILLSFNHAFDHINRN